MTQEYTPTDNDVKADYVRAFCSARNTKNWSENSVKGERAFNRWLAAHDAQIRAEAWDEGHRTAIDDLNNPDCFSGTPNPYMEVQQ